MPILATLFSRMKKAAAAAFLSVLVALPAMAQGTGGPDLGLGYATAIGLTTTDIRTTISRIISYFLGFLGIIAVGIMLYAGFLWMTAGGNEEKISTAKKWMINGTIGLVIIMSAFAITQFVFRAITGDDGLGGSGSGNCPPGQVCSGGFGGGGFGGFKIGGITPFGPGPSSAGWPKNYGITITFNTAVSGVSITPTNVEVKKCNARLDGGGAAQPFASASCTTTVAGTLTVQSNKVLFKPSGTPGDNPTDFEGDFWYVVRAKGGAITDVNGRTLLCPFLPPGPPGDISSPQAQADLCDRAIAFNSLRDVAPPTVSVDSPTSSPAYCGVNPASVHAVADDDFLVGVVDFLVDGGTDKLLDAELNPSPGSIANANLDKPFIVDSSLLSVDIATMTPGSHTISAVAQDGVPQSSTTAQATFTVTPPHCCNAVKDDAEGETGVDCGGACGSCNGSSCSSNSDCSSGYCNPLTKKCEERPVIDDFNPKAAGPGSLITIKGRFLGDNPGSVTFLGGPDPSDDVVAAACAPGAWKNDEVVVAVPANAVTGPLKLTTAGGPSDQTDDDFGAKPGNNGTFTVNATVLPGICYVEPDQGTPGNDFLIHGSGFGDVIGSSTVALGSYAATVASGGWTAASVKAIVPPVPEKTYPVKVVVNGTDSNTVNFLVAPPSAAGLPKILEVVPDHGPVGSYVTVIGTGFGGFKGTVRFKNTGGALHCVGGTKNGTACTKDADCPQGSCSGDIGLGDDPICANNWKDNYVIVKVPSEYQGGLPLNFGALPGVSHKVQIVTAPPAKYSNDDILFRVTNEPLRPGLCAIEPDNGRPGKAVSITGEGFGSSGNAGPGSAPRYSVEFFKSNVTKCINTKAACSAAIGDQCAPASDGVCAPTTVTTGDGAYSTWSDAKIDTIVAGDFPNKSTWPASGPVYVVANNQLSSNAVPFTVGDCNDAGASCPNGTECCANGSCQGGPNFCAPPVRNSAYGWLFSTSILPSLPVVVENAICKLDPAPAVLQSPSPYKESTDACKNAEIRIQFSTELQTDLGSLSASVEVRECGNDAAPGSCDVLVSPLIFSKTDCSDGPTNESCKVITFTPPFNYNGAGPTSTFLKDGMWYQVRLVSNPGSNLGFREPGPGGRFLDGDLDRKPGGDYVYKFRVQTSGQPCALSKVFVDPPKDTIDQDEFGVGYAARPTGVNCNSLQCTPGVYSIVWYANNVYLALLPPPYSPPESECVQKVKAKIETPSTPLEATMSAIGTPITKKGESDITVKFAEPRIIEMTPVAGCTEACINAAIEAKFNVPMNENSLTAAGNIELLRCRNASCTPPFLDLGGQVWTAEVMPPDETILGTPDIKLFKHFTLKEQTGKNLLPSTFYLVRVKSDNPATPSVLEGVYSRSSVPLGGLNDGLYYSWKFRTKDDPTACLASRAEVKPSVSTLFYVGERKDLTVSPFGSPDECSKNGQLLDADDYDWQWTFDNPNHVLGGFIDGNPVTPVSPSPVATLVNTNPVPKQQCTAQCLLRGSQNVIPQCGNGVLDAQYEECDIAITPAVCSAKCLLVGTIAPTCGNKTVNAGESCDMVQRCDGGTKDEKSCTTNGDCPGGTCADTFAPGCKKPGDHVDGYADDIGCIFTGTSSAKGSVCGDGFVSDGESCDDGNTSDGDGCNKECVREGTLPSCKGATPGQACLNFCGNGKDEPGEDAYCELGPNGIADPGETPTANGCDAATCLRKGTKACGAGIAAPCCGNGIAELGEDAACETDPAASEFCSTSCLLKGSSAFYTDASFCGDNGFPPPAGKGEQALCEQPPDAKIDSYQVTVAQPQVGFDAKTAAGSTSQVRATTTGIATDDAGIAKVALSCTCKTKPENQQDAFCETYGASLACATNGCCAPRPKITAVKPPWPPDICRNAAYTVSFDQLMDAGSIAQNVLLGTDFSADPNATCPAGTVKVLADNVVAPSSAPGSFIQRVIRGTIDFFRGLFFRDISAAGPPVTNTYCSVPITVDSIESSGVTETTIAPTAALPANTWVRLLVKKDVKNVQGVSLLSATDVSKGVVTYFRTKQDICTIDHVEVIPSSILLWTTNPPDDHQGVVAHAKASSGEQIASMPPYEWDWQWTPQPASTKETASVVIVNPDIVGAKQQATADVRVRGSVKTDLPVGYVAHNGEAVVEATAHVKPKLCDGGTKAGKVCAVDGDCAGASCKDADEQVFSGTSDVTVFLCDNPWPARRLCPANGSLSGGVLPWDPSPAKSDCVANSTIWYPFYDPETRVKFYYCRDGAKQAGDALPASLPDFNEKPVIINPGKDIIKEYLFTYATKDPKWAKDAVGLRLTTNLKHVDIMDWYRSRGFGGNPVRSTSDGYEALKDGRTTYVSAGSKVSSKLFTNVAIMSYTDGASAETTNIFNQIIQNVDFNYQEELKDQLVCRRSDDVTVRCITDDDCKVNIAGVLVPGYGENKCDLESGQCKDGAGVAVPNAGMSVGCNDDLTCKKDKSGEFMLKGDGSLARGGFYCDAPKSKLVRDVLRWAQIDGYRRALVMKKQETGAYPRLDAGSYIVTMSNSTWPSWNGQLRSAAGFGGPVDPLNDHGFCKATDRDGTTCWSDAKRSYLCPSGSHVYEYQYFQDTAGPNFRLRNDFEYYANAVSWSGGTCPERSVGTCAADPECVVDSAVCTYKDGRVFIGRVNPVSPQCKGTEVGKNGVCGDGQVDPATEECEPGQAQAIKCTTAGGRAGMQTQKCTGSCKWELPASGVCEGGSCGDGVIQSPPETCDDGPLNGKYGYCGASCTGKGFFCGDGQKQPSEACDCKDLNGQYYFDAVPAWSPKNGIDGFAACGTTKAGVGTSSCTWDCTAAGPRCGDGQVSGAEVCDGGFQEAKGFCDNPAQTGCEKDIDCGVGVKCMGFCPEAQQKNRRECRPNDPTTTADNTGSNKACTWTNWKCTVPGSCGNGVKEGAEECDDGNDNNKDGCIIDPAKGIMCKLAKCGDGFVYAGAAEECDEGKNNNKVCTPAYGLTCTYCTSACKTAVKSGGYCGDNIVQSSLTNPSGPEDCDGGLGLSGEYICVSNKPEHRSYGKRTGDAVCDAKTCLRTCAAEDSQVCPQYNSDYNNWENDSCQAGAKPWCGQLTPKTLKDVCDPDDDNDGVPVPPDCDDKNYNTHGAYVQGYTDENGAPQSVSVAAAVESCDGKDNDCDGLYDEGIAVSGKIIDPQTGGGLANAKVQIICGATVVAEAGVAGDGSYSFSGDIDKTPCNGVTPMAKVVKDGGATPLCNDTSPVPLNNAYGTNCIQGTKDFADTTIKPAANQVRTTIKWSAGRDLDFHMVTSEGGDAAKTKHLYYSAGGGNMPYWKAKITDGPYSYVLDVDDTGSSSGYFNPGGIETMTIDRKPGVRYDYYVYDYTSGGSGFPDYGLSAKSWHDDCSVLYYPIGGSGVNNTPAAGKRYIAYWSVPDVSGPTYCNGNPSKYTYCVYPGAPLSPNTPAYCSSIDPGPGNACKP